MSGNTAVIVAISVVIGILVVSAVVVTCVVLLMDDNQESRQSFSSSSSFPQSSSVLSHSSSSISSSSSSLGISSSSSVFKLGIPKFDFYQPWLSSYWDKNAFVGHLQKLKAEGFVGIIMQQTADVQKTYVTSYYGESSYLKSLSTSGGLSYTAYPELSILVDAAIQVGFDVWIGIANDYRWWEVSPLTKTLMDDFAAQDNTIITEAMSSLSEEQRKRIKGIYLTYEFYDCPLNKGHSEIYAELVSKTISYMEGEGSLVKGLPLIISPFHSDYYATYEGLTFDIEYQLWKEFFEKAGFREGDMVLSQDFGGAYWGPQPNSTHAKLIYSHLDATHRAAVDAHSKATIGSNIEIYCDSSKCTNTNVASVERVKEQLEVATEIFCSGKPNTNCDIISFSFSHYSVSNETFDREYREFLNNTNHY